MHGGLDRPNPPAPPPLGLGWLFDSSANGPAPEGLDQLAGSMFQPCGGIAGFAAGYTYFAQLIDHDMSRITKVDPALPQQPANLVLASTPRLELSCLYGSSRQPLPPQARDDRSPYLLVGRDSEGRSNDLPRDPATGLPCIADLRNDDNFVIAQMHVALLKLHNLLAGAVQDGDTEHRYEVARAQLTALYQHLVLSDFLRAIIGDGVYGHVVSPRLNKDVAHTPPNEFLPFEFLGAAFRFGHSTIRADYKLNGGERNFTLAQSLSLVGGRDIRGTDALDARFVIDWPAFFERSAASIDAALSSALQEIRDGVSLAHLDLRTGRELGLPTGQAMARELGARAKAERWPLAVHVLQPEEYRGACNAKGAEVVDFDYHVASPAWHYILVEAAVQQRGRKLGTLGSWIVARTIVDLIDLTEHSVLTDRGQARLREAVAALWGDTHAVQDINITKLLARSAHYPPDKGRPPT